MSTWICPVCQNELGELNPWCVYCEINHSKKVYNPNPYYIREISAYHIGADIMNDNERNELTDEQRIANIESNERMTPQEKLYAQLFYHETILVRDMDTLTLRAHIDELSKIAFEAKVRYRAADEVEKKRSRKSSDKPAGFTRSVNTDETTTNAINAIKGRQEKLTNKEKMLNKLIGMYQMSGMSREEAEKTASSAMGAGTILARLKEKDTTSRDIITGKNEITEQKSEQPVFNPFAKKE